MKDNTFWYCIIAYIGMILLYIWIYMNDYSILDSILIAVGSISGIILFIVLIQYGLVKIAEYQRVDLQ